MNISDAVSKDKRMDFWRPLLPFHSILKLECLLLL